MEILTSYLPLRIPNNRNYYIAYIHTERYFYIKAIYKIQLVNILDNITRIWERLLWAYPAFI